ncbi:2OG-Fe(II) oxygenase family protein [bacterium]|nr:2OG-Fe(II) oxygenase family protein [bacterium]
MIKSEYFASPVYIDEKPEWVEKLDNLSNPYIKQARDDQEENNKKRLTLGYKNDIGMTYHSLPLEPDENFRFFHDYVAQKSRWCLDDMGYKMDDYNLVYTESWVQEFSFNGAGHHWFHTHGNNHISGFFFLKASDKTSRPFFQDPRTAHVPLKLKEKEPTKISNANDIVNFNVKPGTLMLFPAYMSHAYMVDHGIEPFRFIHINIRAVEKDILSSFSMNSSNFSDK